MTLDADVCIIERFILCRKMVMPIAAGYVANMAEAFGIPYTLTGWQICR